MNKIIRTKWDGTYELRETKEWGTYLCKCADPTGTELPEQRFELTDNFPKIPGQLWGKVLDFFFEASQKTTQLEAAVILYRRIENPREWKILVPRQEVTIVSVKADLTRQIDIENGVLYPENPKGWAYAGSAHSHHTMKCGWSGTDDQDETQLPGLHLLVYSIDHATKTWKTLSRISMAKQLYDLPPADICEPPTINKCHPNAIQQIITPNRPLFLPTPRPRFEWESLPTPPPPSNKALKQAIHAYLQNGDVYSLDKEIEEIVEEYYAYTTVANGQTHISDEGVSNPHFR